MKSFKSPWLFRFLAVLPIMLVSTLVMVYGVNIPIDDGWDMLYLFDTDVEQTLTFYDFWRQLNEHRLVFPKLIFYILGKFTQYNVCYEMGLSIAFAVITLIIIRSHLSRNRKALGLTNVDGLLLVYISFLVFTLSQYQNWLWGFQLQWFLNQLAVTAGFFVLTNYRISVCTFLALILCGALALFSLSNGILYWVILVFLIGIKERSQRKAIVYKSIWSILLVVLLFLYLTDYHGPSPHSYIITNIKHPIQFVLYVVGYIGSTIAERSAGHIAAYFCGFLGIGTFLWFSYWIVKREGSVFRSYLFFWAMGAYGILSAVLTAAGRLQYGFDHSLSSRYGTISLYVWIPIMVLLYTADRQFQNIQWIVKKRMLLLNILFVFMTVGSLLSIIRIHSGYKIRMCAIEAIESGKRLPCVEKIYPDQKRLWEVHLPQIKKQRLTFYRSR